MRERGIYRKVKTKFIVHSLITLALITALAILITLTGYRSKIQLDMTEQKLFTLTEESKQVLSGLKQPVRIALVCETGREEPMVKALLREYEKQSSLISVSYIDAEKNPSSLAEYRLGDVVSVYNGSIIIEGADRTKIIRSEDLFSYTSDGNYFYGEREITGAVRYTTASQLPMVYFVTGHGEVNAGLYLKQAIAGLTRTAYGVGNLVLLQEEIPEDARILVIVSPDTDVTDAELEKLRQYMGRGGKLFLSVDPFMAGNDRTLPNLNALVRDYGIDISNNYVVEENSGYYLTDNDTYLIPRYSSHQITAPLGELQRMAVLPLARGLGAVDYDEKTVNREVLLLTSEKAWARNDMKNTYSNKTAADIAGPLALGFAAQKSNVSNRELSSRLVVLGDSDFMTDSNYGMQANALLFGNCMDWLLGGRDADLVSQKVMNSEKLLVSGDDFKRLVVICCAVLPLICFGTAFLLWKYRRNG